jgi:hypothetical protein
MDNKLIVWSNLTLILIIIIVSIISVLVVKAQIQHCEKMMEKRFLILEVDNMLAYLEADPKGIDIVSAVSDYLIPLLGKLAKSDVKPIQLYIRVDRFEKWAGQSDNKTVTEWFETGFISRLVQDFKH